MNSTTCDLVGKMTSPCSYLHRASVTQPNKSSGDVRIADSGGLCHVTHTNANMHDVSSPPPGYESITSKTNVSGTTMPFSRVHE